MKEQGKLLVGFDLSNDYSQISCYNNNTFEPETIKYDFDSDNELISTVMAVKEDTGEWLFADEALQCAVDNSGQIIENIVKAVENEENITVMGKEYDAIDILSIYFRKSLSLIKRYHPNDAILKLVVSIDRTSMSLVKGIFAALEKLNLNRDRVSIQSHSQSYMYYALSQKKELWMNDVALFDFGINGLRYYRINMDRRHKPVTAGVWVKDYITELSYDMIDTYKADELQGILENIASNAFHKQIISTVYLTGKGFKGRWVEKAVNSFCQGKRIFIGQNLFSEGACYAARELAGNPKLGEFILMSEDMIGSSISVNTYFDAKEQELIFVKGTTTWYEAEKSYEFILCDSNEIEIVVRNELLGAKKCFIIAMDLFQSRPDKTTRVKIAVKFVNVNTCAITVRDLGFGEFYPATNRVWEKIIKL